MKKVTPKLVIVVIVLVVALVGYYAYLANENKAAKDAAKKEAMISVVQQTLSRDLQKDYPGTPKEVIKYYNEIMRCFYNEKCTEGDIEDLGQKARELYDDELLEANEMGSYMIQLREDIQEFKDKSRRITSFAVSSSINVERFEENGYSFARLMCTYNVMEGEVSHPTKLVYLLREDDEKRWKIYGWDDVSKLEENQ